MVGQEQKIIKLIRSTYRAHLAGNFANPHSSLLTVPGCPTQRAWALPAYIGNEHPAMGIKWIASFPENTQKGLERASGVIVLNSLQTGRPQFVMDAGRISAMRTAASAVLATQSFLRGGEVTRLGIVGCGRINSEVLRLLMSTEDFRDVVIYDLAPSQIDHFMSRVEGMKLDRKVNIESVDSLDRLLGACDLISIATTAINPHIHCWKRIQHGSIVLHLSLRDFPPEAILKMDNVVDDVDHVFRNDTSIDLASRLAGNRNFVRTTIGEILDGKSESRDPSKNTVCFSPFGLGILDIAVARHFADLAQARNIGTAVDWY